MNLSDSWVRSAREVGILVDANLLVLLIIGWVNPNRIETFKRTRGFVKSDYDLLLDLLVERRIYSLAHVLSEVSNLTDLHAEEGKLARRFLRETVDLIEEPVLPSREAAHNGMFERLGLTDAAIVEAARVHGCAVLTNDLDLYLVSCL